MFDVTADGRYQVKQRLCSFAQFKKLNLMDTWPHRKKYDVIFCRNVLIYFDRATQTQLIRKFANLLVPGGKLMIGHSESAPKTITEIEAEGKTCYRRLGYH